MNLEFRIFVITDADCVPKVKNEPLCLNEIDIDYDNLSLGKACQQVYFTKTQTVY